MKSRIFWSAYCELMTHRLFIQRGWSSSFQPSLKNKTPDFIVKCSGGINFVAEVLTAFQFTELEKAEKDIYRVASFLDKNISHRMGVIIQEVQLPPSTVSLKPLVPLVRAWLDECKEGLSEKITLTPTEIPVTLTLYTTGKLNPTPKPIIEGCVGVGIDGNSSKRFQKAIKKKLSKYGAVMDPGLPLMLFLWEGDWFTVSDTALEWALYGHLQVNFSRKGPPNEPIWSLAPNGLFSFGVTGKTQHRRLSAVAYCSRIWNRGRIYARVQIYHHPYANNPLPKTLFKRIPQFVPFNVSEEQFSCKWHGAHRGYGVQLK